MAGMPYLLLGAFGFFAYRSIRAARKKAAQNSANAPPVG